MQLNRGYKVIPLLVNVTTTARSARLIMVLVLWLTGLRNGRIRAPISPSYTDGDPLLHFLTRSPESGPETPGFRVC